MEKNIAGPGGFSANVFSPAPGRSVEAILTEALELIGRLQTAVEGRGELMSLVLEYALAFGILADGVLDQNPDRGSNCALTQLERLLGEWKEDRENILALIEADSNPFQSPDAFQKAIERVRRVADPELWES